MVRIATIILILSMCRPATLMAGIVLQAGEIDSSKVEVGAYAEVSYGTGERDTVSGVWEKLDTARGYVKAVDAESLTLERGFRKQIAFERIQKLILAESSLEMDRLKKTTDILLKKENKPRRIAGKLAGGVLGGVLGGIAGGAAAMSIGNCDRGRDIRLCSRFFVWWDQLAMRPACPLV